MQSLLLLLPHMDNICLVLAQSAAACARPKPSVYSCTLPHTTVSPSSHIPACRPGTDKPLEPSSTTAPLEEGTRPQELLLVAGLQPRLTLWQNQHCQWLLAALRGRVCQGPAAPIEVCVFSFTCLQHFL